MNVYTFSDARQQLAKLLDQAAIDGAVRITRRDGRAFLIVPDTSSSLSPLGVPCVEINLTTKELLECIHESRRN